VALTNGRSGEDIGERGGLMVDISVGAEALLSLFDPSHFRISEDFLSFGGG